jgi:uncharacterized cupredoxin-like copper-binding protein
MTKSKAQFLVIVGAIGLLSLLTFAGVVVTQGRFSAVPNATFATCAPTKPTGTVVNVTLGDRGSSMMGGATPMMAFLNASPSVVHAGDVTFVATNVGVLTHEFLILPAPHDGVGTRAVRGDGKVDEATSLAEASTSCGRGPGGGIAPGATSWVTLHLSPGNYELLCDEPWHYASGMFQGFTVQ